MKRLSDYHDEDAIELWTDLLEPITAIMSDEEVKKSITPDMKNIDIIKKVLKKHKSEVVTILKRIDDTEITAFNLLSRSIDLVNEIMADEVVMDFLGLSAEKVEE